MVKMKPHEPWSAKEKTLCVQSQTKDEFLQKYISEIGAPSQYGRIDSLWASRAKIIIATTPEIQKISKVSTAIIPRSQTAFADEGEVLVHISNKLSELIKINESQARFLADIYAMASETNKIETERLDLLKKTVNREKVVPESQMELTAPSEGVRV